MSHQRRMCGIGTWGRIAALSLLLAAAIGSPARAVVLLTGDYIQLPVDSTSLRGRFMAEGNTQGAKFNAAGTGGAAGVDFWQPGTPVYNYTVAVGSSTFRVNGQSWATPPVVSDTSSGSTNSATISGSPVTGLQFSRAVSFADGDQVIAITDTLTNSGAVDLTSVATLDNADPDQNAFPTLNDVVGRAVFAQATSGSLTVAFGSPNPLTTADASGFSNTNPYSIIAAPADPNGASGDIAINLAINYGTLTPGQSISVTWFIAFGADLVSAKANFCSAGGAADTDGDAVCDAVDNCPALANPTQADGDADGFGDACDACVGAGITDTDGDGVCDGRDNCPAVSNPSQADADLDGLGDACDSCVGTGTSDTDGDGFCDGADNCPTIANPTQADGDGDGFGDACDSCIGFGAADADGDGVCDQLDNCPAVPNPEQVDCDFDGLGDACDPDATDTDGDQIADPCDNCPAVANPSQSNCDGDGLGDACDPDATDPDGDGVADPCDNCPTVANPGQEDLTGDGVGNACDQGNLDTTGCYRASDTIGPPDGTEPTYSFVDISTTGTVVPIGSHQVSTAIPLGFTFEFYGTGYSQVFVSSNGFLTFLDTLDEGCCGGGPLPNALIPNGLITGLWAHLHPTVGSIFSQTLGVAPNRQFVLQFSGAQNFDTGLNDRWEILLNEGTNEILVEYATAHGGFTPTTAGIENPLGTIGLRWAGPGLVTLVNQAVRYVPTAGLSTDGDGDGRADCIDNCPIDPNPGQEDTDGNGHGDACNSAEDADGDEWADTLDNCPAVANPTQADSDFDGFGDACDACVGFGSADTDGDGFCDGADNCPAVANPTQADSDFDGVGDACDACFGFGSTDTDGDGHCDGNDNCPTVANPTQTDSDFDGLGDACDPCFGFGSTDTDADGFCDGNDNCPTVPNPEQANCDLDAFGDACDPDTIDADGDQIADPCDNCPSVANASQSNCDNDALGDACDPDASDPDGDGIVDPCDNCPSVGNAGQEDSTGDGVGDACDQGNLDTTGCYRASDTIGPPDGTEPTYAFVDIAATGTVVPIGLHQVSPAIPIGFTFDFYGTGQSQAFVSSNGFLTFLASQGEGCCGGQTLPNPAIPNGLITGLWAHLHPAFGSIFSQTLGAAPNRQFVVQFNGALNVSTNFADRWEIILNEGTNEILVQYATAQSGLFAITTAGIENALGTIGLRWAGPGRVTLINQAVRYAPTAGLTTDADGDGRADCVDNCPSDPNPGQEDTDGNGLGDACNAAEDADGDEWADTLDNCPAVANPTQADFDGDGFGDACDVCFGFGSTDTDADGFCDENDNCPTVANPTQADSDFDGVGDVCDACFGVGSTDTDGDGFCDLSDNCPTVANPSQSNCDQDSLGDACDPDTVDTDGDGLADACDPCPLDSTEACASLFGCTSGASALFRINPTTGLAARIGPMNVIDCGGLARDPLTGTLFAAAHIPATNQQALWTVDPTTGAATLIGPMGVSSFISDLAFRSDGVLYSIHSIGGDNSVGTVDLATGAVSLLGPSGTAGIGNGIAFDPTDRLLHANQFTINELSQNTGQALPLASLVFPPVTCFSPRLSALSLRASGEVFGILTCDAGAPYLVTVDPETGVVSSIGHTEIGLEGIAFDVFCGDGFVTSGEECDDGNSADGDCCSSACEAAPNGIACSNGLFCDGADTCVNGVCSGGAPVCPGACDEAGDSCVDCPAVAQSCRSAAKSTLFVRNKTNDERDKLIWRWRNGAATTPEELGDPTSTTNYFLCLYRAGGTALLGSATIPADANKWSARGATGFIYRDSKGAGAVRKAQVKAGGNGAAKAMAIGKGVGLPDLPLPLPGAAFPLVVQLSNSDSGACWEGRYESPADVIKNEAGVLKARTQ